MGHNTLRRRLRVFLTAAALTAWVLATNAIPHPASAADPIDSYLGVWNYTHPDRAAGTNIASLDIPVPVQFPQIGTVTFAREPGGVTGTSDQGCTWHFIPAPDGFALRDPTQSCFNKVIGSSYTMTVWNIRFQGDHASETIHAISHQPLGDIGFTLPRGERQRANTTPRQETLQSLTGTWTYTPANVLTGVNTLNWFTAPTPQTGTIHITPAPANQIHVATLENGCTWTLSADGNTAELSPPTQTCQTPKGQLTMTFWAISSNGTTQHSVAAGQSPDGTQFQLTTGELTH
ncbi:hypothetical protein [Nocardia sp. NPDC056100]|uniref:hypothetical protein n=1 Tax=Nocardia sp. NPDC056100 TaxID=3345712 RepID=UPI0035E180A7